ncbi:glycogen/starch synthase [Photobacterium leiognathi]|uniref:glycogen/starch synthase n=1 Tax=Photobacterium leiognathi TaxID=553611 RepID=UPI000C033E7A|nr:glycogen/starch synthase [Photobacterium leiognathi]PHZ58344.1 hypothetical protein CRG86_009700 [Photobacterium leiognathi]
MKVAYITPSLEKCGPNVVLHNTVQGMLENDVECEVFYFNKSDKELKFECPTKKITDYTSLYRSLKSFDVVHSNGFKADFVLLLLKTFTPLDSKIVTTIHNNVYHDLYYGKGLFFHYLLELYGLLYFVFLMSVLFYQKMLLVIIGIYHLSQKIMLYIIQYLQEI